MPELDLRSGRFFCLTEGIDFDTLPVDELFEMVREIAIYIRASSASKSIWDLVPQVCCFSFHMHHYHFLKYLSILGPPARTKRVALPPYKG